MANTQTDRKRLLVEIAVVASLATVLGFFKLYRLPWGGSVSLKLLPLFYLAFRRGPKAGMAGGFISGLITFMFDPVFLHPLQVLLDFILPYISIGIAGWFHRTPRLGICLSSVAGLVFHVISGAIFFAAYAPDGLNRQTYQFLTDYLGISYAPLLQGGMTPWLYSFLYNSSYTIPELVIMIILVPYATKRLERYRYVR